MMNIVAPRAERERVDSTVLISQFRDFAISSMEVL
jgi:hypothetical protein